MDFSTQNFAGTSSTRGNHECTGNPNAFCYVCAKYIGIKNTKKLTDRFVALYEKCFNMKVSLDLKNWIPNFLCGSCYNMINRFEKHQVKANLKFKTPAIWKKPLSASDCYFCTTNVNTVGRIHKDKIFYPSVSSVQQPVANFIEGLEDDTSKDSLTSGSDTMEVDVDPENAAFDKEFDTSSEYSSSESEEEEFSSNEEYRPIAEDRKPEKYDQKHLNDLFREAKLSKEAAEILASSMKKRNLLTKGTTASVNISKKMMIYSIALM